MAVLAAAILSLIILVGCAKKDAIKTVSDEDVLRERVQLYWSHVMKEAFDKSYEMEHPLYKKNVPIVEYIRGVNMNVKWTKVEIQSATIGNEAADIELVMDTRIKRLPAFPKDPGDINMVGNKRTEKWAKVDGIWYHVPKKFRAAD